MGQAGIHLPGRLAPAPPQSARDTQDYLQPNLRLLMREMVRLVSDRTGLATVSSRDPAHSYGGSHVLALNKPWWLCLLESTCGPVVPYLSMRLSPPPGLPSRGREAEYLLRSFYVTPLSSHSCICSSYEVALQCPSLHSQ